mmetsp:Transcript_71521/g.202895  ORF Transcript_71521/g.202895 Transcript_71521/m.202895 type:complete len:247 (-) Transcript_71521:971-1711(-)
MRKVQVAEPAHEVPQPVQPGRNQQAEAQGQQAAEGHRAQQGTEEHDLPAPFGALALVLHGLDAALERLRGNPNLFAEDALGQHDHHQPPRLGVQHHRAGPCSQEGGVHLQVGVVLDFDLSVAEPPEGEALIIQQLGRAPLAELLEDCKAGQLQDQTLRDVGLRHSVDGRVRGTHKKPLLRWVAAGHVVHDENRRLFVVDREVEDQAVAQPRPLVQAVEADIGCGDGHLDDTLKAVIAPTVGYWCGQ